MKISIQNQEKDLLEIDAKIELSFLEKDIRKYYPDQADVHVVMDRFGRDFRIDIGMKTKARYKCDRCLEDFSNDVDLNQRQLFHVGEGSNVDERETVVLPENTIELDLAPMLKEMVVLGHPIKMLCSESCKGICPNCGVDLNKEKCTCTDEPVDPRWAQLKKLIK